MSSRDYRRYKTHKSNYKYLRFENISRRIFIIQSSALAALLSSCSIVIGKKKESQTLWDTVDAIYGHIFPHDGFGPDAKQINTTNYLKSIFHSGKTSRYKKRTILNGEILVNKLSNKIYFSDFYKLTQEQKEKTLREVEKKDLGERFLSLLIDMLFESMLGDPVYGAQPNFAGWQWLEHIPGFPRPDRPHPKVV